MAQPAVVNSSGGVLLNVAGSALFALLYGWTHFLSPLNGDAIYGWRMLLTVPCMALFVLLTGRWHEVRLIVATACGSLRYLAERVLSAVLLGTQLWLFMWAPVNGYGLDVSLGYFLLPISMVIIGRFAFKDRISRLQLLACVLAVIGIACQIAVARTLSWPALVVCVGYPGYFWLRRVTGTNTLGSTWIDMALSLPVSLLFVLHSAAATEWTAALPWLIAGLGVISAAALVFQALSAPRLNLSLFGLLIYVEPVLLVVVALLLGEAIPPEQWPTYIAIWLAVLALVAEGAVSIKRKSAIRC